MSPRPSEHEFFEPSPLLRELQVLSHLAADPEASQKEIGSRVGLAASMVHNYIHAMEKAGCVRMEGVSRKRMRYVVTEAGRERIRTLSGRFLAETGRMLERVASRARREIERAVRDGMRMLGVVARPALADTVAHLAAESGLSTRHLGGGERSVPAPPASALEGLDAVLVAEDFTREDVSAALSRCREQGLRIYTFGDPS
jgi:DNA-binding MarR family transcriptional regulator